MCIELRDEFPFVNWKVYDFVEFSLLTRFEKLIKAYLQE